jgi:hypothetical protein
MHPPVVAPAAGPVRKPPRAQRASAGLAKDTLAATIAALIVFTPKLIIGSPDERTR